MFGIFSSQHSKTRRLAHDWLELADKVFCYRRDVLAEAERSGLAEAMGDVRQLLREKADTARLKLGIDSLEAVLRRCGGQHYPKSGLVENVEFFLVAAIVILGLRAFYVQPFKIPTNSMWPSYFGMTGRVYAAPEEEPSKLEQLAGFATVGASARRIDAPDTGEVLLPMPNENAVYFEKVKGRTWLVIPAQMKKYSLTVGQSVVSFKVPADYDMESTLRDFYFPGESRKLSEIALGKFQRGEYERGNLNGRPMAFIRTGKFVRKGERLLSFDILTGDQLFVDRVSYHFVPPKVGDGFVFRTGNIPYLAKLGGDQYYIKRLVGLPGDELKIERPVLYRNGEPITGAPAFGKNAEGEDSYVGYRAEGNFANGATVTVEADHYMAMGDNSANSLDGRYWGTVPKKDAVGRPLFIYYPFTKRWGPAP